MKKNKLVDKVNCELEDLRMKNIKDNKSFLAKIMKDIEDSGMFSSVKKGQRTSKPKPKVDPKYLERRRNPSRRARPTTRQRSREMILEGADARDDETYTPPESPDSESRLIVNFGFFGGSRKRRLSVESDEDSKCDIPESKRRRLIEREVLSADEITEVELNAVSQAVKDKCYDQIYGTSCHQCRQKTDDMKTICRSDHCVGVRGQFCGVCLRNRYGEDAREALKDPNWECPPCRGICNCSICRRRKGISATGVLVHIAHTQGFPDVNAYLQSLQ